MSGDETMSLREEMAALVPFYLNGTLAGDELLRFEEWLASEPDAAAVLGEAEFEFSGDLAANEAIRPPADALRRFEAALDREAGPVRQASATTLAGSLWSRFMAVPKQVAWAVAAAAVAILVVQAIVGAGREPAGYEVAGAEADNRPFVLVTFTADARLSDIAAMLEENGASLSGGPLPGGMFRIAVPAATVADYEGVVATLRASPLIASLLPGRRPSNDD